MPSLSTPGRGGSCLIRATLLQAKEPRGLLAPVAAASSPQRRLADVSPCAGVRCGDDTYSTYLTSASLALATLVASAPSCPRYRIFMSGSSTTIVGQPWMNQASEMACSCPSGLFWKLRQFSLFVATACLAASGVWSLLTPISANVLPLNSSTSDR